MTRQEHMNWCKQRAIELINLGDINQGLVSMMSDLGKHPETQGHGGITLTSMLMFSGHLNTREAALKHINGFN